MKIFKTKFYLVRTDNENDNSVELVGGPFDRLKEAEAHVQSAATADLDVWEGTLLLADGLRIQEKRPHALPDPD